MRIFQILHFVHVVGIKERDLAKFNYLLVEHFQILDLGELQNSRKNRGLLLGKVADSGGECLKWGFDGRVSLGHISRVYEVFLQVVIDFVHESTHY